MFMLDSSLPGPAGFSVRLKRTLTASMLTLAFCSGLVADASQPPYLSYRQLNALATNPNSLKSLRPKINRLLNTPFIYRQPTSVTPLSDPALGHYIRVASWNIERGYQAPHIVQVFNMPNAVGTGKDKKNSEGLAQAKWLSQSQVLFLTEVDNGMNRTGYQNVAFNLAKSLHMNAVYGVEFIELGPLVLKNRLQKNPKLKYKLNEHDPKEYDYRINPSKYRGLHGSALLTRYPILKVEIIRLPKVYDWYTQERKKISQLEKVKRKASDTVFLEDVLTEVRVGSRIALAVDLKIPELPGGKATFVVTHLENRVKPAGRVQQMQYLLARLKNRHNPIVFGGDFNTTGTDVSPTSVRKEIRVHLSDPTFWTRRAINLLAPYSIFINLGLSTAQFSKNLFDPAAPSVPLILPNRERELFVDLEKFKFADGTVLDTRGDRAHAYDYGHGLLANSNERWLKGFVPTFSFERPILKGLLGRYKLDWFLVKDYMRQEPDKDHPQPYRFAPHYGRTLTQINHLYSVKISDHDPITIDLPLREPKIQLTQPKDKTEPKTPPERNKNI